MAVGRIFGSNRGVRYGDGGLLKIRPYGRGEETNDKEWRAVGN